MASNDKKPLGSKSNNIARRGKSEEPCNLAGRITFAFIFADGVTRIKHGPTAQETF